jgi:sugar phosphate isomerase/epimerase
MAGATPSLIPKSIHMNTKPIELLASYFTLAGDVYPFGPTEISPHPLKNRAEAASKAGWKGLGFALADLVDIGDKIGLKTAKQILDDNGLPHREIEFLTDWYLDGDRRKASDAARTQMLETAAAIGARKIKIAPGLQIAPGEPYVPPDVARMSEGFASVCESAAKYGVTVVLEIMPFSNVRTIDSAVAIVQGANQPNGGLLVDNWHIQRGGMAYSEIAKIPKQFLKAVELDDAAEELTGSIWEDTIYHRQLCGEGCFNPPAFIEQIQAVGYDDYYGVEILSEVYRKQPLEEIARRIFETTMAQFQKQD